MKNSIKLSALLLLLSTGLFAATPVKAATGDDLNAITVQALRNVVGFGISIQNNVETKATVTITDDENRVLLLDKFKKAAVEKAYNLSELDNGDYAVTINANQQTVTKQLRVYNEYGKKAYVFLQ